MRFALNLPALLLPIVLLSSAAITSQAEQIDDFQRLANDKLWLRLLHYEPGFSGKFVSRNVNPTFFFSANGAFDPVAELRATHEAFSKKSLHKNPVIEQAAVCAFPARRSFLEEKLKLRYPEPIPCTDFLRWQKGLNVHGVSLIFSTYFPTNPASMFGHTFLRLDQTAVPQQVDTQSMARDLLSYAVSFAALVDTENPLVYAYKGLFGEFVGFFSIDPYYMKTKEYGFGENRDLWEYQLALNDKEIARLVEHLWELFSQSAFDYYFFDENCSTYILNLLEVAKPEWDLQHKKNIMVLPSETVKKVIEAQGGPQATILRLSYRNRFLQQYEMLSKGEKQQLARAINQPESLEAIDSAAVLDAWLQLLQLNINRAAAPPTASVQALQQRIRQRRLAFPARVFMSEKSTAGMPHLGHEPTRLGLSIDLARQRESYFHLNARGGFHRFSDPLIGYPLNQEVSYLGIDVTLSSQSKKLRWHEFTIIDVLSSPSFVRIDPQFSWFFSSQIDNHLGPWKSYEPIATTSAGVGLASEVFGHKDWQYLLFVMHQWQWGRYQEGGDLSHQLPGLRFMLRGALGQLSSLAFDTKFYWRFDPASPGVLCNTNSVELNVAANSAWHYLNKLSQQRCQADQDLAENREAIWLQLGLGYYL